MEQIFDPASTLDKVSLPLVRAFYSYQVLYEQKRILIKM